MKEEICALCRLEIDNGLRSDVGVPCQSEDESTCHAEQSLRETWEKEWDDLEPQWRVIVLLNRVKANEPYKILKALSYFDTTEDAVDFANENIKRYTTSNFAAAWFYEEIKRIAKVCSCCEIFKGKYGNCKNILGESCKLDTKKAFYNQKTVAQQVAEELGITYLGV